MNQLSIITLALLICIISLSAVLDDPRNPPLGRTGAPGELTCQTSECHKGGSFVGTVSLTGIPDTVNANQKYSLTLTQTSNALRAGFEMTSLDGSNTRAGTFAIKDNSTNVATQSGRQYIRQARAVLLSNGFVSWSFDWTAPANISTGDTIRFYFVSNACDNNDRETGDNIFVNAKKVFLNKSLASLDLKESDVFDYLVSNSELIIKAKSEIKNLQISSLNGIEVSKNSNIPTHQTIRMNLTSGVFILSLEHISGKKFSRKIVVE